MMKSIYISIIPYRGHLFFIFCTRVRNKEPMDACDGTVVVNFSPPYRHNTIICI